MWAMMSSSQSRRSIWSTAPVSVISTQTAAFPWQIFLFSLMSVCLYTHTHTHTVPDCASRATLFKLMLIDFPKYVCVHGSHVPLDGSGWAMFLKFAHNGLRLASRLPGNSPHRTAIRLECLVTPMPNMFIRSMKSETNERYNIRIFVAPARYILGATKHQHVLSSHT